ncbi:5193_t:CDS:2 [Ambispora gerdemannii]|uniref:5193_t:CDS:1 n=1 Tax=Ambispora gerdemannii TaxID=144530 RepID=A0A9N9DNB8_9GLOM|nr:5193_t:CDS:2 [Ambispora gerdemannii]
MSIQTIIESIKSVNTIDLFILIFATCISTYIFNFYYKYYTRPNPLPGPFPLPFFGNSHNCGPDVKEFYEQCQQKYGDICEVMLDRRYIILSRPNYIKKLFSPAQFYMRLPNSQGTVELGMCNHGLFFNETYKSWNYNKQFFAEALSAKFIEASIININQIYEEMSGYWQSLGKQNASKKNNNNNWTLETDFSAWFHGFINDVTSILATGKRTYSITSYYNTLSINKSELPDALVEDGNNFVKALVKFLESLLFFSFYSPFTRHYVPIFKSKSNSYLSNRDYLYNKLDNIVKKRRTEIKEMPETRMKKDMLTSLITAETVVEGEKFKPMTDVEIRMNLLDIFLGGSDTTANLFCFITYYLCKHPNVKEKMLSEIDSISKSFGKPYLSCDDLRKLKYCEAIIKEASRLMAPVPFTFRHTTSECEIAGYKWPAGTDFHINFAGAHGHPECWDNPKIFDPDKFCNNDNDNDNDRSAWMPFGGGKRICPGKNLATIELLLLMSSVYKNYNVELVNEHEPLKVNTQLIANCTELKVRISPRT